MSTFTYDAKDRLTQDATSAPLAHTYTYTYDSRDNILTNSESGAVVQMNYDAASRLTTSTAGGVTTTYTFDSNGNLTGVNAAGTLTTMVYDKENRLKEHKQGAPGSETAFTYDLNSLKQSTTSGLVTDQLVWDGADMLGEVPAVKPVGAPLMPIRYNLAQGILFATTRFEPAATRTDTGADFIGSILTDFDENGDYVAERRYKPYGELLAGTATTYGWTGNTGSRFTVIQFAEQYNRRRHYSTKLKQWTTRDPLWPDESAYGYVNQQALQVTDPEGRSPFIPVGPPTTQQVSPSIIAEIEQIYRQKGRAAAVARLRALGIAAAQIATIIAGIIALVDLGRYATTGQTGPFTSIGVRICSDCYDQGGTYTLPLTIPSKIPKEGRTGYPKDCPEAGRLVHKLCDVIGGTNPPKWNRGKGWTSEEAFCLEVRVRMSRAKDCYLARLLAEKICGKKGDNGKIDGYHWDQIDGRRNNYIDGLKVFNEHNCWRFL